MASLRYLGIYDSIKSAIEAMRDATGEDVPRDRTKREPIANFLAKADAYPDWVVDVGFVPADFKNQA